MTPQKKARAEGRIKEKLQTIMCNARLKLMKIEERERIKEAKQHLGRFYKYRNCYSCPNGDSDYWWMFRKITGMDKYGNLTSLSFQKDKNGKLEIDTMKRSYITGWTEITKDEYYTAWEGFLAEINGIERRRKGARK